MERQLSLFKDIEFSPRPNIIYPLKPRQGYCEDLGTGDVILYSGYPNTSFLGGKFQDLAFNLIDILTTRGDFDDLFRELGYARYSYSDGPFELEIIGKRTFERFQEDTRSITYNEKVVFEERYSQEWDTNCQHLAIYEPGNWEEEFKHLSKRLLH